MCSRSTCGDKWNVGQLFCSYPFLGFSYIMSIGGYSVRYPWSAISDWAWYRNVRYRTEEHRVRQYCISDIGINFCTISDIRPQNLWTLVRCLILDLTVSLNLDKQKHIFELLYLVHNTVFFLLCRLKINHVWELRMFTYSWDGRHGCEQLFLFFFINIFYWYFLLVLFIYIRE